MNDEQIENQINEMMKNRKNKYTEIIKNKKEEINKLEILKDKAFQNYDIYKIRLIDKLNKIIQGEKEIMEKMKVKKEKTEVMFRQQFENQVLIKALNDNILN